MTKDEALQLALETLKFFPSPIFISDKHKLDDAIEVIKEALETKDEKWGSSSITNPEFVAEQKEKTQQLRNMVDAQNMASKSTYKEQLETKDEPVAWMYWQSCLNDDGTQTSPWVQRYSKFKPPESVINKDITPLYTAPPQRTWVGLTEEDLKLLSAEWRIVYGAWMDDFARDIEAKLKDKNT